MCIRDRAIAILLSLTIPQTFFVLLPRLIGCWILLHAIVKIIVFYIRIKDHLPFQILKVMYLCGDLIMAFYLLVNPDAHEEVISFFIGAYFIIYGGNTPVSYTHLDVYKRQVIIRVSLL